MPTAARWLSLEMIEQHFSQTLHTLHGCPVSDSIVGLVLVLNIYLFIGFIPDKGLKSKDDSILLEIQKGFLIIQPDPGRYLEDGTQGLGLGHL